MKFSFKMSYKKSEDSIPHQHGNTVFLEPSDDTDWRLNNVEPQMVRIRGRNSSYTFIDNFNHENTGSVNRSTTRLASNTYLISGESLLAKRTKRFSLSFYESQFGITNINPRNNNIVFTSSNTGGTQYSVTLPEGVYTASQLQTVLINGLNTVSGSSGLSFSITSPYANTLSYYTLTSSGGSFTILPTCNFATTGYIVFGMLLNDPRFGVSQTSITAGPMFLASYTRYVNFCSASILNFTKSANVGNFCPASLLFRLFIGSVTDPWVVHFPFTGEVSFNMDAGASISTADIALLDEFNQPLYFPNSQYNPAWFALTLTDEL